MIITNSELTHLAPEFDAESWEFLLDTNSELAKSLEKEIADGRTPEQIWFGCRKLLPAHRHNTICFRLFQAARHLYREAKQQ